MRKEGGQCKRGSGERTGREWKIGEMREGEGKKEGGMCVCVCDIDVDGLYGP